MIRSLDRCSERRSREFADLKAATCGHGRILQRAARGRIFAAQMSILTPLVFGFLLRFGRELLMELKELTRIQFVDVLRVGAIS
jgi:hypothetical protein